MVSGHHVEVCPGDVTLPHRQLLQAALAALGLAALIGAGTPKSSSRLTAVGAAKRKLAGVGRANWSEHAVADIIRDVLILGRLRAGGDSHVRGPDGTLWRAGLSGQREQSA